MEINQAILSTVRATILLYRLNSSASSALKRAPSIVIAEAKRAKVKGFLQDLTCCMTDLQITLDNFLADLIQVA